LRQATYPRNKYKLHKALSLLVKITMLNKNLLFLACTAIGTTTLWLTQATAQATTISVNYRDGAGIAFPADGATFDVGEQVNFRLDAPWQVSGTGPGKVLVINDLVVGDATLKSQIVYQDSLNESRKFGGSGFSTLYASKTFTSPGKYTAFGLLTGLIDNTTSRATSSSSRATTSSITFEVVPEPLTILGSITALGLCIGFKRKQAKANITKKMS
jgi:hypothetical protein